MGLWRETKHGPQRQLVQSRDHHLVTNLEGFTEHLEGNNDTYLLLEGGSQVASNSVLSKTSLLFFWILFFLQARDQMRIEFPPWALSARDTCRVSLSLLHLPGTYSGPSPLCCVWRNIIDDHLLVMFASRSILSNSTFSAKHICDIEIGSFIRYLVEARSMSTSTSTYVTC